MNPLTKRQKQIFDFVDFYITKKGSSPTLEEIKKHFKLSALSTVHQHVDTLVQKGYLDKSSYEKIGLKQNIQDFIQIPLIGTIAAGQPIEAIQTKETIAVSKNKLPKTGKVYALRVAGDSMIDENINDGDVVIIKEQNTAENGQKVVALIDNYEATLKKFYKEKDYIRLQPANKQMEPIIIDDTRSISIQGVLFDVIKNTDIKESKPKVAENKDIKSLLNKVFNGDIMDLLKKLPDESIDMVFGDPDYNVGIKYGNNSYTKDFQEYINWYIELTKQSMRVLKKDGNLFMMNYPKQNAHLRVKYLDNHFPLVCDYAWTYNTNVGHTPKRFTTAHRSILHVRKIENNKFYKDAVAQPYKNPNDKRILKNLSNGSKGRMPYSWFYFDLVKNVSKEKTYHACQIPQKLTDMLLKACTKENDDVLVLFGGSGAELEVCKNNKRNFISAEIDPNYCSLIVDRLKNGIKKEHKPKLGKNKN
ncbi:MAG: transcriptional repressor LexA [Candidatus Paceibacterota bacterium]|jgi:SOS regulatory protein LexA